jgi:predicted  nucleic acid-binding Zn-ribbon protein
LVLSCNDAIAIVETDRKTKFDVDIKSRNESIETNNQAIANKKIAIQKLSEEITALEQTNDETKQRISIKTYLYNNFATQLINKIKADFSGIQSFIN